MNIVEAKKINQIIDLVKSGKVVIFPTETSYGLGCDATNQSAVDKIFAIKGRVGDKPLLVVVPDIKMAKKYLKWNTTLDNLAQKYWPGALTMVGEYDVRAPLSISPLAGGEGDGETRAPLSISSLAGGEGDGETRAPLLAPPLSEGGNGNAARTCLSGCGNGNAPSLCKKGRAGVGFRLAAFFRTKSLRQSLRKDQTKAEKILWNGLRDKKLGGLKFRQQHGIGPYIADFYQSDSKIIVEVDGDIHFSDEKNALKDNRRKEFLEQNGYQILRYNNVDVFNNLSGVLDDIYYLCNKRLRDPLLISPLKGGESELTASDPTLAFPFLQREGKLANGVVAPDGTVAVRVSADSFLQSLTKKLGCPLVATSANLAGAGEIYDSQELIKIFENADNAPDAIVDAGILPKNLPSTIVSVVGNTINILRQGEVKID